MLSVEDNELITKTDRGTPMGEVFRRFWIPALLADEIPAEDCDPVRVRILGENLVAFRDSEGRPGVISAFCAHRGAPMFFGRNEDGGIRCVYHGWKYDVTGQCIELPNVNNGETVAEHTRTIAYPAREAANLIWVYMGPPDREPPFPELPFTMVSDENVYVTKYEIDCNYLQALEGSLDPTHAQFLHSTVGDITDVASRYNPNQGGTRQRNKPGAELTQIVGEVNTEDGVMFGLARSAGEGQMVVSGKHLVFPTFIDNGLTSAEPGVYPMHLRIPIDDEHLMYYRLRWTDRGFSRKERWEHTHGGYVYPHHIPGTYRAQENIHNDYNFDPVLSRQFSYSGIATFPVQDQMMIENQWGPIQDRTQEHLVAADAEIIFVRERFLNMARAYAEGIEPDEPFHMQDVQFSGSKPSITVPTAQQVPDEVMDELLAAYRTKRVNVTSTAT